jgi:DNA-directed RNA polymerase subunit RPC12/RpoP
MKRTPIRRRSKDYKAKQKVKKDKDKELEELYGVKLSYWRYKGLKGIYWHLLSKYVRLRDFKKFGTCISCGKEFSGWTESQAGHYAPAKDCGFILLFDPRNVNGECAGCNNPYISPGKLIKYRLNLVKRYGEEYVAEIDGIYAQKFKQTTKAWTAKEYDIKIKELQEKISQLENEDS